MFRGNQPVPMETEESEDSKGLEIQQIIAEAKKTELALQEEKRQEAEAKQKAQEDKRMTAEANERAKEQIRAAKEEKRKEAEANERAKEHIRAAKEEKRKEAEANERAKELENDSKKLDNEKAMHDRAEREKERQHELALAKQAREQAREAQEFQERQDTKQHALLLQDRQMTSDNHSRMISGFATLSEHNSNTQSNLGFAMSNAASSLLRQGPPIVQPYNQASPAPTQQGLLTYHNPQVEATNFPARNLFDDTPGQHEAPSVANANATPASSASGPGNTNRRPFQSISFRQQGTPGAPSFSSPVAPQRGRTAAAFSSGNPSAPGAGLSHGATSGQQGAPGVAYATPARNNSAHGAFQFGINGAALSSGPPSTPGAGLSQSATSGAPGSNTFRVSGATPTFNFSTSASGASGQQEAPASGNISHGRKRRAVQEDPALQENPNVTNKSDNSGVCQPHKRMRR